MSGLAAKIMKMIISMARKKNETGPAAPERGDFIGGAWTDLDVPGSFASAPYFKKGLVSAGKKPPERLAALLKTQPDFRKLSRPSKKAFPTRPFPAFFFNDRWEMDLFDMGRGGWRAGGKPQRRFILLVVDVFSRKLFSACLKNKTASESAKGLAKILAGLEPPYAPPRLLHTDKGREFRAEFAEFLKKKGIRHVLIDHTRTKARYAERAVRSFKRVLMGYINTRKTTPSRQHVCAMQLVAVPLPLSVRRRLQTKVHVDTLRPNRRYRLAHCITIAAARRQIQSQRQAIG